MAYYTVSRKKCPRTLVADWLCRATTFRSLLYSIEKSYFAIGDEVVAYEDQMKADPFELTPSKISVTAAMGDGIAFIDYYDLFQRWQEIFMAWRAGQ
ncbi:hypothetical protein HW555_011512 [Spodoptera exigua]|uniref:Uncharacterized protein n=1 Tax=Spodoptera exigua TaxID=7107 RepID=A0A835G597_SPOEX|nr:hypothetical protein HW555_011512 [Spodoptera exigua]